MYALTLYGQPQRNESLYSSNVIGALAVDGWAVTYGTARRAWAGCGPTQFPPRCTKCNSHPSTANVPISYYSMWHFNCLCILTAFFSILYYQIGEYSCVCV